MLNNINGYKVKEEHALAAIENACGGAIEEGNVGGGTGMRCHGFKGGTGTASRVITDIPGKEYKVGILVQANHGTREELRIKGIPFGKEIKGFEQELPGLGPKPGDGSIILNAMVAAETMEGRNRNKSYGIPHDQIKAILKKYEIIFDRP